MNKRPSIKGKGADVFFPQEGQSQEGRRTASRHTTKEAPSSNGQKDVEEKRIMATFYLPPDLVDKLDRVWVERRIKDRKVQKSHIVAEALYAHLKN